MLIAENYSSRAVSISTLAYAALFLCMARYLYQRNPKNDTALVMLLGKASIFLVITVPILFSGNWVTLFWSMEAVVLLWAATRLRNLFLLQGSIALLALVCIKFLFHDYAEHFRLKLHSLTYSLGFFDGFLERLITSVIILASLFTFPRLIEKSNFQLGGLIPRLRDFFYVAFGALLFAVLNIEVVAFFNDYAPEASHASLSVLWTFFSICLMALGFLYNQKPLRQTSIALFCLTIIKVFFQDLAEVATPYRILSLLILGLMLIGASYLYHRYSDQILSKTGTP